MSGADIIASLALAVSAVVAAGQLTIWFRARVKLDVTLRVATRGTALADGTVENTFLAVLDVSVAGGTVGVRSVEFLWLGPEPQPDTWGWHRDLGRLSGLASETGDLIAGPGPRAVITDGDSQVWQFILAATMTDAVPSIARTRAKVTLTSGKTRLSNEIGYPLRPLGE